MTRQLILKNFTDNIEAYQKLALNIGGEQDANDLFQMCSLMVFEFSEERIVSYWNPTQGLKPFFIRMLCNQYKSKNSKFHSTYRKLEQFIYKKADDILLNEPQSEDEYDPKYFDKIGEVCKTIYSQAISPDVAEFEKMVWEFYIETGSLRKTLVAISKDYAGVLDLKGVHTIVKKFRRTIKISLNLDY